MSPVFSSAYCIERVSKAQHKREDPCKAWQPPLVEKRIWSPGRPRQPEFPGQRTREEWAARKERERPRDLQKPLKTLVSLQLTVDYCMCVTSHPRPRKELSKELEQSFRFMWPNQVQVTYYLGKCVSNLNIVALVGSNLGYSEQRTLLVQQAADVWMNLGHTVHLG